jgi:hypothetical protein
MDVLKMIDELRAERAAIEDALVVLERLAHTRSRRRGRPPVWLSIAREETLRTGPGRVFSAETRRKMAEAQKKRWAAARKSNTTALSK